MSVDPAPRGGRSAPGTRQRTGEEVERPRRPVPGDVLAIGRAASVQFDGDRSLVFRVTAVCDKPTYHGWVWITGYPLDSGGRAIERREIFVRLAGLRLLRAAPVDFPVRRIRNTGPVAATTPASGPRNKARTRGNR